MKQKIEVQVTAAMNEQWPKVFPDTIDAFRKGAKWVVAVAECASQMALYDEKHDEDHAAKQKPDFLEGQNIAVGFKDFDSMVAWWTNPQPVKAEPEKVTIESLPNGGYFQFEGGEFVNVKTGEMNGTRYVFQAAGQHVGYAGTAMPSLEVIPFYGTITINVGRGAE